MATSDISADSLFVHRMATMEERGFNAEEALKLVQAKKLISNTEGGRTYFHEVPVTWHDVAKLQKAGATNKQILRILT